MGAALVLAWLAVAAVELFHGLSEAQQGLAEVQQAKAQLSASDLVAQAPTTPLKEASASFASAHEALTSPALAPFDIVPVLGRQLGAVQDLSAAAGQAADVGVGSVGALKRVLDTPHTAGPHRVLVLRQLSALAATTHRQLEQVDPGPGTALVGPVASKYNEFVTELDQAKTTLAHASQSTTAIAGILQGPSRYLVLMANNAEMRAGSGSFLEAGVLTSNDGSLQLGDLVPTADIPLAPGAVAVSAQLEKNWGFLDPGVDWRNLGLTPQFDVNGQLAASMWQAKMGQHVDGVMTVDVVALTQLLAVTGPVTLPDGTVINSSNAEQFLLHDQYAGLSYTGTDAAEAAREQKQGALAEAEFNALDTESLDLKSLSDALSGMVSGRHIMVWTADPATQATWETNGVAGTLSSDSTLVALINRGGNKLDPYIQVTCTLQVDHQGSPGTTGTLTVKMVNTTPPGQGYIGGPYPGLGTVYGEYPGFLAVNLPAAARNLKLTQGRPGAVLGAEGPAWVLATPIDMKAGQSETDVIRFSLPASGSTTVLSSARVPGETWHYDGRTFTDTALQTLTW
ncbi:MAG TPA: DUF4012 domain-containing protein [Acidimicrobiales bacterium]|nr:DUF4012 domain-containing protein [Acidimicrobiales bacterium]